MYCLYRIKGNTSHSPSSVRKSTGFLWLLFPELLSFPWFYSHLFISFPLRRAQFLIASPFFPSYFPLLFWPQLSFTIFPFLIFLPRLQHSSALQYVHAAREILPDGTVNILESCLVKRIIVFKENSSSFFFLPSFFRVWRRPIRTPRLPRTTPCWCSTTRAAALPPAHSALCTHPAPEASRTTTTSTNGDHGFAN